MIEYLSVTPNKFSKKLGYNRTQTIYDIINCKSAPSFDFFNRLFNSEYSVLINPLWLLTGKGDLLNSNTKNETETPDKKPPGKCELCIQKNISIDALQRLSLIQQKTIDLLNARIDDLEKKDNIIDDGQKRKAG